MTTTPFHPNSADIRARLQAAGQTGELSRQAYLQLASALLADTSMSARDRVQINRLFDAIRAGRVKLVN